MDSLGRTLVGLGLLLLVVGGLILLAERLGLPLGHLPGDLRFGGKNFTCLVPLATMILLSVVLTIAVNLLARLLNR